jgi:UDP-3-O-[3-hydroxymyristoyl] glucosamine N-acyltransferase
VTIGDRVMVVAKAGIHNDLKDDAIVSGIPAVDVRKFRRYAVVLTRLPEIIRRVRALEHHAGIGGSES